MKIKLEEAPQTRQTVDEEWEMIQTDMIKVAEQCLGSKEQRRKEEWFDIDCEQALMERNKAKMELDRNRAQENIQIYNEKRKLAKKICRNKKDDN
ncbi:hypothetical protein QE152_g24478 [Popillia japonica]|uniref:Uncharacterized protein n=1 Tax=Popillia japonica TaxID=7064 RepID=A0AAW1KFF8_POPJA